MGVDVVVVNYRTPDDLIAFIHSFRHVREEVESTLTVVNVEPSTQDHVVGELFRVGDGATYIEFSENVGYNIACNSGAAGGSHRTVALFNADTRLKPGVLKALDDELWAHDDWGVIGPRQIDDYGKITAGGIFGTNEEPSFAGRWQANDDGQFSDVRDDCVSIAGSAYFVKREVWDELTDCKMYQDFTGGAKGAFLPARHYYGETFASYHARAHGWRVVYYGSQCMTHLWHKASSVGGIGEQAMPADLAMFRAACLAHEIPCE